MFKAIVRMDAKRRVAKRQHAQLFEASDSEDSHDEEAVMATRQRPSRALRVIESSDEDSDEQPVKRRRLVKGKKPASEDVSDSEVDENCELRIPRVFRPVKTWEVIELCWQVSSNHV